MIQNDLENAVKNLVKTLKNTSKVETFNDLGTEKYVEKSTNSLKLAPTSFAIHGRVKRYTYVIL